MENFQIIFNIVVVGLIYFLALNISLASKIKRAKGNAKDIKTALLETIGAGIILFFIILLVFSIGYSSLLK